MREMELDAVESAGAGAAGGGGEPVRDAADLREVEVLDLLAVAVEEVTLLAGGEMAAVSGVEVEVLQGSLCASRSSGSR